MVQLLVEKLLLEATHLILKFTQLVFKLINLSLEASLFKLSHMEI